MGFALGGVIRLTLYLNRSECVVGVLKLFLIVGYRTSTAAAKSILILER